MRRRALFIFMMVMVFCMTGCGVEEPASEPAPETKPAVPAPVEDKELPAETPVPAQVHFIDVGQGDCTLIDVGEVEVLVDCGKSSRGSEIVSYISDYVDGELDYLVATHPDDDHIGGILTVLRCFTVGTIIDSGAIKDTYTYYNYMEEVENLGVHLMEDEETAFSLGEGASLQIIETGDGNIDVNEDSVVCVFRCGEVSVLLTGDMGIETENKNLDKFPKVDVLKAGHHGSSHSTGAALLEQTHPDYVIISAGKNNDYGHPAPETLQRISDAGAISYSTIDQGTILLKTDGVRLEFEFAGPAQVQEPAGDATYNTGESGADPAVSSGDALTAETTPYIGNANSYKFHHSWCKSVKTMAEHNKVPLKSREEALERHFEPCQNCDP